MKVYKTAAACRGRKETLRTGRGTNDRSARGLRTFWCARAGACCAQQLGNVTHGDAPQFCDEERDKLKGSMTKFSMSVLSKTLSERWRLLSDVEKQPYKDRSAEAKAAFVQKWGDTTKKGMRSAAASALPAGWKLMKDASSGAPVYLNTVTKACSWVRPTDSQAIAAPAPARKPKSASAFYVAAHKGGVNGETSLALQQRWRTLTDEQKAPYAAMHDEDVRRYKAEQPV